MKHDAVKMRLVRESMGMTQEKLAILSNVSDPDAAEMEPVLSLVGLIEERLPTPWEFDQHPAESSLGEKIRLAAQIKQLLEVLAATHVGLYAATSWINAKYPRWDMDEGVRYTHDRHRYEKVMTLRMIIARGGDDRIFRTPIAYWGLDEAPRPEPVRSFGDDLDDDMPF